MKVCSILSLCFSIISFFVCWWLSIAGVILGVIALSDSDSRGLAIAGTATGGVALFVSIICVALGIL